jgi:hypothetical protein
MNSYTNDNLIQFGTTITDLSGNPSNASQLTFKVKTPDLVVTDLSSTIANVGVGQYTAQFYATQVGLHQYEWVASGTVEAAQVSQFLVDQAVF